jgi:2-C-methyl-D-erythritol 4-phosphate cytidylyltransferase/2-C-methyl-D-erythritol 2,4-cyclodiphosphate synthase
MTTIDVLIVAAGTGARFGGDVPKQFLPLAGVPMLRRTVNVFASHPAVRNIQVVIGAGQEKFYDCDAPFVTGGARRQDSVLAGLEALAKNAPDYVLIVDAARPFTTHQIIDGVIAALTPDAAVLTAIPVADTIKLASADHTKTLDRKDHYLAQTPQAFPFAKILALHRAMKTQDFTDDVALFEARGLPVHIAPGSARNFKITTAEDFQMAEALLQSHTETRIGHGFDVHRFRDGDHVWLGGIKIPHTHGVDAHSDGDVILHALTDALLGAIGAGDIGQHFPPTDAKWKNASSDQFVRHAVGLLHAAGGAVVNADVTVLCEAPKVGPHRDVIRARIAELLGADAARVNIKATTTEKLGALGRGEGLAAEAVVCIKL